MVMNATTRRAASRMQSVQRRHNILGYLYVSPWIVGFMLFTFVPMISSLVLSFTRYRIITPAKWIGIENYAYAFTQDDLFWSSLGRTFYYSFAFVPLSIIGSLLLAILLNQRVHGEAIFRTLFYLPSLTPAVAAGMLWAWILNSQVGLVNYLLSIVSIKGPPWLGSTTWAIPSIILITLWTSVGGGRMIIFLAGLQGVPEELYEAADMDGAGRIEKLWHVTLPMISPTILFNLVLGVMGALQVFTTAYVTTKGGPGRATWFFALHIYSTAFLYFDMGYGCTLAWVLFAIVICLTILQFRLSDRWVYYASGA